jgi:hypothetical protein
MSLTPASGVNHTANTSGGIFNLTLAHTEKVIMLIYSIRLL